MIGINVDHRHWTDMNALARTVVDCGANAVRTVLKPNEDERFSQWLTACNNHGLLFLSVTARESVHEFNSYRDALKYYAELYGDVIKYWQLGNEPDGPLESDASWRMNWNELDRLLEAAYDVLPKETYKIGPGLVSGQHKWVNGIDLSLIDALAGHHYDLNTNVTIWADGYKAYGKPFWVTEYPFIEATTPIRKQAEHGFFFCLSDVMKDGNGLLESIQAEQALFYALATSKENDMPEYVLGFADYANTHPEVGDPLTNEYTQTQYGSHVVQAQLTTNGLLFYHSESNTITFLPKK